MDLTVRSLKIIRDDYIESEKDLSLKNRAYPKDTNIGILRVLHLHTILLTQLLIIAIEDSPNRSND